MDRRMFLALPAAARAASRSLFDRVHAAVQAVETIDTHEHLPPEAQRVREPVDFFTLASHYAFNDVVSAGLPAESAELIRRSDAPPARKWQAFEPYWRLARGTGYGQALRIAVRDIYGAESIEARTLPAIDEAIAARNKPGLYRQILVDRARIRFALNDAKVEPADAPLLRPARRFDHFLVPKDVALLEKLTNSSIGGFAQMKNALAGHVERAAKNEGMASIKIALAYQRDLRFEAVPESEAAAEWERQRTGRKVVDHLVHHLLGLADAFRVPVQVHTGMLAGNGADLERTRPSQLVNVFQRYGRVPFDVFHVGYPYWAEAGALAKVFPNVYADFCWTHVISPAGARQALHEMLDSVPANKIFGFGGDYRYPELSYAHLVIARRNIATVLALRVEEGAATEDEALALARRLLHDNPAQLYKA